MAICGECGSERVTVTNTRERRAPEDGQVLAVTTEYSCAACQCVWIDTHASLGPRWPEAPPEVLQALETLARAGWNVNLRAEPKPLPRSIAARYAWLREEDAGILSRLQSACRGDEKVWLLTPDDFEGTSSSAFAWDEWETMSLDAADDEQEAAPVRAHWDRHMPIAFTVEGGYGVWALRASDHAVVYAHEPSFEETSDSAANLVAFLRQLAVSAKS